MDRLLSTFGDLGLDPRLGGADSFCDRLNCRVTVFVLIIFSLMVTAKFYVGEPISCWCPAHFEDSHVDFTNKFCWTTNTYILPYEEEIPKENDPHRHIGYYQWVSLILACQAIMFYLPRPIWRLLNKKSGIAVSTITDAAIECQKVSDMDVRDKTIRYMVKHMGRFLLELSRNQLMTTSCKSFWLALYGNYLVIMYIVIKLIYLVNVVGQLYLLNLFLDTNFNMYGIEIMRKMIQGVAWTSSDRFPRVTMCDFKIRVLGNVHRYTVQCSLPMNLFNEIIFIFIWFWFAFVAAATVGSLIIWLFVSLYFPYNRRYVKSRLVAMDKVEDISKQRDDLETFVSIYLRRDGCFIIRMVAKNASDIIAAELLCGLWGHFLDNKRKLLRLSSKFAKDEDLMDELNA